MSNFLTNFDDTKGVQLNAPTSRDALYSTENSNVEVLPLHRRSIRLGDYDYAQQGAYFITVCTQQKESYFENPVIKQIAEACWLRIPSHFLEVELDEWVIMPNHLHGVLVLNDSQSLLKRNSENYFSKISPAAKTLAVIIRTYKAAVTTACRRAKQIEFAWQRNYYEHIIRNEADLNRIRQYILENPSKWAEDAENPARMQRPS